MPYNNFYQYPTYQQQYPVYPQYQQQVPYQPQIQPQTQQVNSLPTQAQNTPISPKFDVVQGELAANMYQTENGQEVILMDMDNPFVYHKKRGLDGKLEPMKKFQLVEVTETQNKQEIDLKDYVKQEEIENLIEKAVKNEVERRLSDLTLKPSTRKKAED